MQSHTLAELVGLLQSAALDPDRWQDFLSALCRASGSSAAFLHFGDLGARSGSLGTHVGLSDDAVEAYEALHVRDNPFLSTNPSRFEAGAVGTGESVLPLEVLEATDFYRNWMQPAGFLHTVGGTLLRVDQRFTNLTLGRPSSMTPFGASEIDLLRVTLPFAQQALHIRRALVAGHVQSTLAALTALGLGGAVMQRDGRVLQANAVAKQRIAGPGEKERLGELLERAFAKDCGCAGWMQLGSAGPDRGGPMAASDAADPEATELEVTALPLGCVHERHLLLAGSLTALVVFRPHRGSPAQEPLIEVHEHGSHFTVLLRRVRVKLPPSEAAVLCALCRVPGTVVTREELEAVLQHAPGLGSQSTSHWSHCPRSLPHKMSHPLRSTAHWRL